MSENAPKDLEYSRSNHVKKQRRTALPRLVECTMSPVQQAHIVQADNTDNNVYRPVAKSPLEELYSYAYRDVLKHSKAHAIDVYNLMVARLSGYTYDESNPLAVNRLEKIVRDSNRRARGSFITTFSMHLCLYGLEPFPWPLDLASEEILEDLVLLGQDSIGINFKICLHSDPQPVEGPCKVPYPGNVEYPFPRQTLITAVINNPIPTLEDISLARGQPQFVLMTEMRGWFGFARMMLCMPAKLNKFAWNNSEIVETQAWAGLINLTQQQLCLNLDVRGGRLLVTNHVMGYRLRYTSSDAPSHFHLFTRLPLELQLIIVKEAMPRGRCVMIEAGRLISSNDQYEYPAVLGNQDPLSFKLPKGLTGVFELHQRTEQSLRDIPFKRYLSMNADHDQFHIYPQETTILQTYERGNKPHAMKQVNKLFREEWEKIFKEVMITKPDPVRRLVEYTTHTPLSANAPQLQLKGLFIQPSDIICFLTNPARCQKALQEHFMRGAIPGEISYRNITNIALPFAWFADPDGQAQIANFFGSASATPANNNRWPDLRNVFFIHNGRKYLEDWRDQGWPMALDQAWTALQEDFVQLESFTLLENCPHLHLMTLKAFKKLQVAAWNDQSSFSWLD